MQPLEKASLLKQPFAETPRDRSSKKNFQVRPPCSLVYGEALVAHLAGVLASSLQLDKFILEGDSSIVVSALQNPSLSLDWHIEHIISDNFL